MDAALPHAAIPDARTRTARLTLDALAAMDGVALDRLYRRGTTPEDLDVLDGRPEGRMLAVRGADHVGRRFGALRSLAGARRFPWGGKSFFPRTQSEGRGINRVRLGRARFEWFPFATRVEASVVDGAPCVYLDYEQPGNPFFIAKIRDEIREVAPRLFLGPAMWKDGRGGATHVLWFALDFASPEAR